MIDLIAALDFVTTHARTLERRLLDFHIGATTADRVGDALAAYGNDDGGFGWAIEPDLRSRSSQPVGALLAFEVLEQVAPSGGETASALCDWLAGVALPGGAVPFSLTGADDAGSAPWWAGADPTEPSLHITAAICGAAHRVAAHHSEIAVHPWLGAATGWCLRRIAEADGRHVAYERLYVLRFLDAIAESHATQAEPYLQRLSAAMPANWELRVDGGQEDEKFWPLQFAPLPGGPLRRLIPVDIIERDLDRLATGQADDGGWTVDFAPVTTAAAIEWRGRVTVEALTILAANGRLDMPGSAG